MNKYDEEVQHALSALKSRRNGDETVYTDTPIIFTASQMKSYTPPQYIEMKKLARSCEAAFKPSEWLFVKQARLMEDFTDDFDFNGSFSRFYPTYKDMNTEQLRGYFSWRTKLRQGNVRKTAPGFVFVYIFELLNGIGWKTPEEGYNKLESFCSIYSAVDGSVRLDAYLPRWKKDFVIFYGLDTSSVADESGTEMMTAVSALAKGNISKKERFECLNCLSSHKMYKSPVYTKAPDDMINVVNRVFSATEKYFGGSENVLSFFGDYTTSVYSMFSSAVFYDEKVHKNTSVRISETEYFECDGGRWTHTAYLFSSVRLKTLSAVMKNIDSEMRIRTGCKRKLSHVQTAGFFEDIVSKAIDDFYEEKERLSRPVINIDVSALEGIRKTAQITQKKLIIDEEEEDEETQELCIILPQEETPSETKCDLPLDNDCENVLRLILSDENAEAFCRQKGLMLSVVCDMINEKLFDMFDDNVIEFFDSPVIIEDYRDELESMMGEG